MNRTAATVIAAASVCCLAAGLWTAAAASAPQQAPPKGKMRKPQMTDTARANVYADNNFQLYINGELTAVDSISFIPHNVVSVDILPRYPMTIAVLARDNADPQTGMEYANTNIGDGGFILKFGDGTVTSAAWKTQNVPIPPNWFAVDFDDSDWNAAVEYTEEEVDPKQPYFDNDFTGAKFIWTGDIALDNTVLFRHTVNAPPDGLQRPDFSNINNVVPDNPPKKKGKGR